MSDSLMIEQELEKIGKMLSVMNKLLGEMIILTYPNDKYYLMSLLCENDLVNKNDRDLHGDARKR